MRAKELPATRKEAADDDCNEETAESSGAVEREEEEDGIGGTGDDGGESTDESMPSTPVGLAFADMAATNQLSSTVALSNKFHEVLSLDMFPSALTLMR